MKRDLEKILANLPKPKLSLMADLKIKLKLYDFMLAEKARRIFSLRAENKLFFRNSLAAVMVIAVVFSGTSIYAYASGQVVPGHALYPLKIAVEKAEQKISLTDSAKALTLQKFSERRLEEALHLSQEHLPGVQGGVEAKISGNIQNNIDEALGNVTAAAEAINEIKDAAKAEAAKNNFKDNDKTEIKYLDQIEINAVAGEDYELVDKIKEAKKVLNKYRAGFEETKIESKANEDGPAVGNPAVNSPVKTGLPRKRGGETIKKVEGVKIINPMKSEDKPLGEALKSVGRPAADKSERTGSEHPAEKIETGNVKETKFEPKNSSAEPVEAKPEQTELNRADEKLNSQDNETSESGREGEREFERSENDRD